jgi:hypothetical protein
MLPDLWRIADRKVRALREPPDPGEDAAPDVRSVLAGIAHHLDVDRWFHADRVFADGEKEAARLLHEARVSAPRSVLLAHVLWELCLDGALVRREGLATVLDLLHRGVVALSPSVAERVAALHHFDRVARSDADRSLFAARLQHILAELERGPWIEGYQQGAGVAARLQGVRRSVGLLPMDQDDLARVADVAEALLARAPEIVLRIEDSTRARRSP